MAVLNVIVLTALAVLLPLSAGQNSHASSVVTGGIKFADIEIFYQMYPQEDPAATTIILLHGAKFTSDTWLETNTIQRLGEAGYKVIAVDLPGFGRTRHLPYVDNNMRAEVLHRIVRLSGGGNECRKVLVSPSMSGRYAIPFMDRYGPAVNAWVALAPVGVKDWGGPWEETHKTVKLLAMYGSEDPLVDDADTLVKMFSDARKVVISGAGHACYVERPDEFHQHLLPYIKWVHDSTKMPVMLQPEPDEL